MQSWNGFDTKSPYLFEVTRGIISTLITGINLLLSHRVQLCPLIENSLIVLTFKLHDVIKHGQKTIYNCIRTVHYREYSTLSIL